MMCPPLPLGEGRLQPSLESMGSLIAIIDIIAIIAITPIIALIPSIPIIPSIADRPERPFRSRHSSKTALEMVRLHRWGGWGWGLGLGLRIRSNSPGVCHTLRLLPCGRSRGRGSRAAANQKDL